MDVVLTAHGLDPFDVEYTRRLEIEVDGVRLSILPLDRIIASKKALMRPKDRAQLPVLEATLAAKRGA